MVGLDFLGATLTILSICKAVFFLRRGLYEVTIFTRLAEVFFDKFVKAARVFHWCTPLPREH